MKTYINLMIALVVSITTFAQEKPVKIVFDVTSSDTLVHQSTIRHVKAMSNAYPKSEFEVVMYSGSINMVLKEKSTVAIDLEALAKKENITFVICEGTMKRHKIDTSKIIQGVTSVPDGILEIINKQSEGWGYIKEGK
jgi:intracellular sulfur oxidation DsrE/DsrF family protein